MSGSFSIVVPVVGFMDRPKSTEISIFIKIILMRLRHSEKSEDTSFTLGIIF